MSRNPRFSRNPLGFPADPLGGEWILALQEGFPAGLATTAVVKGERLMRYPLLTILWNIHKRAANLPHPDGSYARQDSTARRRVGITGKHKAPRDLRTAARHVRVP